MDENDREAVGVGRKRRGAGPRQAVPSHVFVEQGLAPGGREAGDLGASAFAQGIKFLTELGRAQDERICGRVLRDLDAAGLYQKEKGRSGASAGEKLPLAATPRLTAIGPCTSFVPRNRSLSSTLAIFGLLSDLNRL